MFKKLLLSISVLALCFPLFSVAQESIIIEDTVTIMKARVVEVVSEKDETVPGLDIESIEQVIKAEILNGDEEGSVIEVHNNYIPLKVGQKFYLSHTINGLDSTDYYSVRDVNRMPILLVLIGLFVVLVIIFGGIQGIRGLVSLIGSFVLIIFVLMPSIAGGFSPLIAAIGVSSLIIVLGSYITHGFNKTTSAAVLGMIVTVLITGILGYISVHIAQLTGYAEDEAIYLNINSGGKIDLVGLLFGGIIIGLLGVLYDVAIGQAISVEELRNIGPHVPRTTIYKRAIRIGREHIGALVNTLIIAYVGASLPLLLLFYTSTPEGIHEPLINQEVFATEIVRTMIGSIGIVIAVPITTFIAVWMLMKKKTASEEAVKKELEAIQHHTHSH